MIFRAASPVFVIVSVSVDREPFSSSPKSTSSWSTVISLWGRLALKFCDLSPQASNDSGKPVTSSMHLISSEKFYPFKYNIQSFHKILKRYF